MTMSFNKAAPAAPCQILPWVLKAAHLTTRPSKCRQLCLCGGLTEAKQISCQRGDQVILNVKLSMNYSQRFHKRETWSCFYCRGVKRKLFFVCFFAEKYNHWLLILEYILRRNQGRTQPPNQFLGPGRVDEESFWALGAAFSLFPVAWHLSFGHGEGQIEADQRQTLLAQTQQS